MNLPGDSEISSSKVALNSSQQLIVYDPVSVVFTLQNLIQLSCTLNLLTIFRFASLVIMCFVPLARGGLEITEKLRVGDSPALAST